MKSEKGKRSTPKTSYPVSVLPTSKKKFQDIMERDEKTVWQLFRDMLEAYENARRLPVA